MRAPLRPMEPREKATDSQQIEGRTKRGVHDLRDGPGERCRDANGHGHIHTRTGMWGSASGPPPTSGQVWPVGGRWVLGHQEEDLRW